MKTIVLSLLYLGLSLGLVAQTRSELVGTWQVSWVEVDTVTLQAELPTTTLDKQKLGMVSEFFKSLKFELREDGSASLLCATPQMNIPSTRWWYTASDALLVLGLKPENAEMSIRIEQLAGKLIFTIDDAPFKLHMEKG